MKAFRLQSILEYRSFKKRNVQVKLIEKLNLESILVAEKRDEQEELRQLYDKIEKIQREGVDQHVLESYKNYCLHHEMILKDLDQKLSHIQQEISRCRQELCQAEKDEKCLDKLKEKHVEKEKRLLEQQETVSMNEIAIAQYFNGR
jgi:flagellar export protein FliJ